LAVSGSAAPARGATGTGGANPSASQHPDKRKRKRTEQGKQPAKQRAGACAASPPPPLQLPSASASRPAAAGDKGKGKGKAKAKAKSKGKSKELLLPTVPDPDDQFGTIDDHCLVRRVYVEPSVSVRGLKTAILATYEDQYQPSEITLKNEHDRPISTDRQVQAVLNHPDPKLRGQTADGRRCVVVSAKNDEESELLVVPLAWHVRLAETLRCHRHPVHNPARPAHPAPRPRAYQL